MGRNRVLSFMSQLSGNARDSFSASPINNSNGKPDFQPRHNQTSSFDTPPPNYIHEPNSPTSPAQVVDHDNSPVADSPISTAQHSRTRSRSNSRPLSMVQSYQPPLMDISEETLPELQPIFTFLNSHANKLYQEGYFLKLDDQNAQGRPNPDRTWTECFAQLVGTVLSLWDAAELDAAGEDGEVLPKFINLTDASIKMIESLPTRSKDEQPLQNILSISTAGRNRYLLHFNSKHSLIQWTAGIRLAIFEHSTLQEAYTGALIAGKGKLLNNIGVIMERSRTPFEEWVRVRFGAGVPWRRCWCVISPPDEKEYQKQQKELRKKSPYDRSHPPILKGDIKFYDTRKEGRKQKKAKPIATITDAYSAYAIYPQAKSLIEASTLIKIEGNITIHSDPPSSTEGFVFIMPEVHPAVTGFEMLLRHLFPTWDTFGLYGRPGRLASSTIDQRSLMFAMPKHKRYGYLEILDVTGLILSDGNSSWTEREWRKKLKELTGQRLTAIDTGSESVTSGNRSRANSQTNKRLSFGPGAGAKGRVGFAEFGSPSVRSSRSMSLTQHAPPRTDSAPPAQERERAPSVMAAAINSSHSRNASDMNLTGRQPPARYDSPNTEGSSTGRGPNAARAFVNDLASTPERMSSDEEQTPQMQDLESMRSLETPEPVSNPPAFSHAPGHKPTQRPYDSPELRRANSRMSQTTLAQLTQAGGVVGAGQQQGWHNETRRSSEEQASAQFDPRGPPSVRGNANDAVMSANSGPGEGLRDPSPFLPLPAVNTQRSKSPLNQNIAPPSPGLRGPSPSPVSRTGTPEMRSPPFGATAGSESNIRPGTAGRDRAPTGGQGQPPNMMPTHARGPPMGPPSRGPSQSSANIQRAYDQGASDQVGRVRPTTPGGTTPKPPPHNTSPPIHRKPLPLRTDSLRSRMELDESSPRSPVSSSNGSFTLSHGIDPHVLAQVHAQKSMGRETPQAQAEPVLSTRRADTMKSYASSHYPESTDSPDYASTRASLETSRSVERPRAGVLRTVGENSQPPLPTANHGFDIPDVDFGPTFNYSRNQDKPAARPYSPGPRSFSPKPPPPSKSPQPPPHPRKSPVPANHSRQESDDIRRSVIWQPMGATPGTSPVKGISAEQFVQQRAAAAVTPLYAHGRQPSGNTLSGLRMGTPTPPLERGYGRDYMAAHSRSNSQDLLQRPGSRGAATILDPIQRPSSRGAGAVLGGQAHGGDSSLSAREQEYVARLTGTPLINMAGNKSNPQSGGGGLVGAIEAREREKLQMRQGYGGQAVQQAINQRQQQQQVFQNYQQPMPSPGLPPPAGMYSNMARMGVPQSPGSVVSGQQMAGQAYGFPQQGAQGYVQGGSYRTQQASFSPGFMPQQAQYSSQSYGSPAQSPRPGQQSQGRGFPAYHGQAF